MKRLFFYCLIIFFLFAMTRPIHSQEIKNPNVAGQFYDSNPKRLASQIDEFLNTAKVQPSDKDIRILIAPHAGYIYSGWVAAYSYKAVSQLPVNTVIIIAPSHYFGFSEAAVWKSGIFKTPLGNVAVDDVLSAQLLAATSKFVNDPKVFEQEHSLEVQIPFIQRTFPTAKIVPIIMGQSSFPTCQEIAQKLNQVIGVRKDVLVVVSSDMSHFHTDQEARAMDHATLTAVEKMNAQYFWQQCHLRKMEMCGFVPVSTAMLLAQDMGLHPQILQYANSGDVTGDKNRVVGYGAVIFYKGKDAQNKTTPAETGSEVSPLTEQQKKRLLTIARETIEEYVRTRKTKEYQEKDPRLLETEGAFVTIHKKGNLRGCIGNIIGNEPLYLTVRDMAIAAAASDPRFRPVSPEELPAIDVEISVLSKPRPAKSPEEITMGVHGVIVRRGFHQGVFLPQVATETGWTREEFLSELCSQKAGLPPDAWKDPRTQLDIFSADVFSEKDLK
jgi:MEMO1 family protein